MQINFNNFIFMKWIYIFTITNSNNEKVIKKLIINQ